MKSETERCLGCGATVADPYQCVGCGACTTRCKFDAISLVRKYDVAGMELHRIKPAVVRNVMKRKVRITVKKAKNRIFAK